MATSKTLAPTNVTISIPAMADAPDASVFSNCVDKEADAINALNSQLTPSSSYTLTPNSDYIKAGNVTMRVYGRLVVISTEGILFKTALPSSSTNNNILLFTNPTGIHTGTGMVSLVRFNSSAKPLRFRIQGGGITPWWEDIPASDNDSLPWYFQYITFLA